ncbi:major facilitator superfamily domain-containing protein [Aspergillus filifer]
MSSNTTTETLWPPGTVRIEERNTAPRAAELILHPQPTSDPNDPLNWPPWRKYLNLALVIFWVAMVAEFINAPTPTWSPMQDELGYSDEILNDSYAAGCAALGVGSLLLIPFALEFGRRPIYLLCTVVQFGVSIWSAWMQTVGDLMGINVIQCFFASLAESIVQMTIRDLFFVHQRGRMNALYVWVWLFATYLGPLVAGFVTTGLGWRWVWWLNVVVFGVAVLGVSFGYEETKYVPVERGGKSTRAVVTPSEPLTSETEDKPEDKKPHENSNPISNPEVESIFAATALTKPSIDPSIPVKTYWQRLSLTTTAPSTKSSNTFTKTYLRNISLPLTLLFTIPAITFTSLVYGILVGLGDVMSTTMSTFLPDPPYNFTSSQVGLMHLPRMIGVSIGAAITEPLSDWWIVFLARRRGGIYEPETRLWCVLPFLLFIPAGALMFGIGLAEGLPWPVVAVGLMLYNVGVAPVNGIVITYLTDCYEEEPCLEGCSSSKIDKVCICLSAWTPERKALLAKYLILFTGWDSSGYGHLCSKFDALMSADGEETETDPKSESTTTTAERVEGYISRESVAEPNFLDMHMAQDGTVLFADLKTKFIIDDRALETDLVLWVEYENNGTPDVIYRVQFVDKYFGDYRVRVAMGDGVEATMGGEEIYGERKEDEIAVEMDPVDFTHPSLDLYVEFNKIGPDDQDNREWAAGIIELSASVYLDAERKGNGIAIGYDLRRVLIDGWKPLEIVER